ncbi:MAG TPA: hypothetical protein VFS00_02030, partial [Polyangiaceae bacterium]|nr:hypothetical protein [Polyangiaceae bacterium]
KRAMPVPYRDDQAALRERLKTLDAALDEVRDQARRLGELERQRAQLEAERDEVAGRLSAYARTSALDGVRVASPCPADWDAMAGDEQVRFCPGCQKNVYNLSGMTREQATALVRDREGDLCVRLYRRHDGTVLTSDCPDARRRKRRRLALLSAGGGLMAAAAATASLRSEAPACRPAEEVGQVTAPVAVEVELEARKLSLMEALKREDLNAVQGRLVAPGPPRQGTKSRRAPTNEGPACHPGDPLCIEPFPAPAGDLRANEPGDKPTRPLGPAKGPAAK